MVTGDSNSDMMRAFVAIFVYRTRSFPSRCLLLPSFFTQFGLTRNYPPRPATFWEPNDVLQLEMLSLVVLPRESVSYTTIASINNPALSALPIKPMFLKGCKVLASTQTLE